ncbi:MFS transporter [Methylocystis sp. WRRC1]|uniref:MFS transporter n=1 Tax=Methylocystis sp. WRRC1 TaxID=1732014 RepID=UPI001D1412CE|nr:MFS transporter [Methylocystis sp. WRRC1]MCC3246456.1 MFS transporter [Methylocystis sp. WRRC1]
MQQAVPRIRQIAAAVIGNALEWYDFIVFGFFTTIISPLFFPSHNAQASLFLTMATFGAGFFTRPLGGVAFGLYSDSNGRKSALQLIILLMTVAVALIAFAPTYSSIGLFAPLLITSGRLLQGFATGGEFASATTFLVEAAPSTKRGLYGSLQMVGQGFSAMLGTLAGIVVTTVLTPTQITDWGWRIPFLIGLLIGPIGLYIRKHLDETDVFVRLQQSGAGRATLRGLLREHRRALFVSFGLTVSSTIYFYVVLVYMPTYGKTELGLALGDAFIAQAAGLLFLIVLTPVFGSLSDRIGRRPLLMVANALFLLTLYPLFSWVQKEPSLTRLTMMQIIFCSMIAIASGPISTALAEQFPTRIRSTGLATGYNLAVMIFGGFAQLIVAWLIDVLNTPVAPAFYVMFGASVGLLASFVLTDRYRVSSLD